MNITLTESFAKPSPDGGVHTCTLEQYDDGNIYVFGDELGELIVEFADDAYEKAVRQLADLGYEQSPQSEKTRQEKAG
jgi:hypothetical protein